MKPKQLLMFIGMAAVVLVTVYFVRQMMTEGFASPSSSLGVMASSVPMHAPSAHMELTGPMQIPFGSPGYTGSIRSMGPSGPMGGHPPSTFQGVLDQIKQHFKNAKCTNTQLQNTVVNLAKSRDLNCANFMRNVIANSTNIDKKYNDSRCNQPYFLTFAKNMQAEKTRNGKLTQPTQNCVNVLNLLR